MPLSRPTEVKALAPDRLWLRFPGGVSGEVDLSAIVGHGVFAGLADPKRFEDVTIGRDGQIAWPNEPNELELCSDELYLELTGQSAEQAFADRPGKGEVNA